MRSGDKGSAFANAGSWAVLLTLLLTLCQERLCLVFLLCRREITELPSL